MTNRVIMLLIQKPGTLPYCTTASLEDIMDTLRSSALMPTKLKKLLVRTLLKPHLHATSAHIIEALKCVSGIDGLQQQLLEALAPSIGFLSITLGTGEADTKLGEFFEIVVDRDPGIILACLGLGSNKLKEKWLDILLETGVFPGNYNLQRLLTWEYGRELIYRKIKAVGLKNIIDIYHECHYLPLILSIPEKERIEYLRPCWADFSENFKLQLIEENIVSSRQASLFEPYSKIAVLLRNNLHATATTIATIKRTLNIKILQQQLEELAPLVGFLGMTPKTAEADVKLEALFDIAMYKDIGIVLACLGLGSDKLQAKWIDKLLEKNVFPTTKNINMFISWEWGKALIYRKIVDVGLKSVINQRHGNYNLCLIGSIPETERVEYLSPCWADFPDTFKVKLRENNILSADQVSILNEGHEQYIKQKVAILYELLLQLPGLIPSRDVIPTIIEYDLEISSNAIKSFTTKFHSLKFFSQESDNDANDKLAVIKPIANTALG